MTGTVINSLAIVAGGLLGLFIGARLPEQMRRTIMIGLGLFTFAIGIQMFLLTENPIIVLISMIFGIILGEWWQVERALQLLGEWFERRFTGHNNENNSRFVKGFLSASLVFCIGPMAILGAIQDGLTGSYQTLLIKSMLDFFRRHGVFGPTRCRRFIFIGGHLCFPGCDQPAGKPGTILCDTCHAE